DAGDRTRLLQRLFSTDRFRRVEDWLAERRRRCAAELDTATGAVLRLASRVAQAAGTPDPAGTDETGPADPPPAGWAVELGDRAGEHESAALAAAEAARGVADTAAEQLQQVTDLRRRQQRRRALLDRWVAVEAARPVRAQLIEKADAARRAAEVRPVLDQLERRRTTAVGLREQVLAARSALVGLGLADASADALRAETEARRAALARLDVAARLEAGLVAERERGAAAEQAVTHAAAAGKRWRRQLAEFPAKAQALQARQEAAVAAAGRLPALAAERERLAAASRCVAARTGALARRDRAAEQLLEARETAVSLREESTRLRNERVDSMIAELAAALVDGDPCAVCGATDHPDPSEVRGSRVTREQEDAARAAAEQAQQVVSELTATSARAEAELAALDERLAELEAAQLTPAALAAADRAATVLTAELQQQVEAAADVEDALEKLSVAERTARDGAVEADQHMTLHRQRAADATARAADLTEQLAALLGGAPSVAAARSREEQAVTRLERLLDLLAHAAAAEDELVVSEAAAAEAVTLADFPDAAAASAALLAPSVLAELSRQIDQSREAEAAVREALADPEMAVDLELVADVEGCSRALAVARQQADATAAEAARCSARAQELSVLVPRYASALHTLPPLQARAAEAKQLADLAAGQGSNRLRMTLSSYVLAARLEEVAAVASERLRRMTQGRYTLVHTDAGRGNGRAGLGLLARDAWTGQDRDTATLSGGETFLASLALALALGDVVSAESGGAAIDALFVDEGFGSLDDSTLDEVMDTLDTLREGGRMVGLVSHVGELRLRIPAQIHVRKGRHGSTVSVQPG
ncbi:MAG: repair protein SbcC/Rad50, partial [Frankiaceae bacterium]|nr:repair protein SbcC/Rad50 [Frankiaceae bacterium]